MTGRKQACLLTMREGVSAGEIRRHGASQTAMAVNSVSTLPPSLTSVGTLSFGFKARNAGASVAPPLMSSFWIL